MPDGHQHRGLASEMPIMVQISCTANRFSWYSSTAHAAGRPIDACRRPPKRPRALAACNPAGVRSGISCRAFTQCRNNVERQLATHRGGVKSFLSFLRPAPSCSSQCTHAIILEGASQPIQAPHHKRVTCTHGVLDLPQPRSLYHGTTDPVDNDLLADLL